MSDVKMPTLPQSMESNGWQFVTDQTPRDCDLMLWHAMLEVDDDGERTDKVVGYIVYVGSRSTGASHWDEPHHMTNKPSADWLGDSWEYADAPSLWRAMPPLMDMSALDALEEVYCKP